MSNINIGQLSQAVENELKLYSAQVVKGIKRETKKSMSKLVKTTKETAPVGKRQKHYKDSIKSRKVVENDREVIYQWYVKGSDYRLSHLLENGHALRDGGRTRGTGFIHAAETAVVNDYEKAIKEVCKNG